MENSFPETNTSATYLPKLHISTDNSLTQHNSPIKNTPAHIYTPNSFFLTDNNTSHILNLKLNSTSNNNNNTTPQPNAIVNDNNSKSPQYKQKKILNKLYGITPEYSKAYESAKKKKYLPLISYQNNILNAYTLKNVDRECFINVSSKLKQIKESAEMVKPLPKVNFKIIYEHSKNEMKSYAELKKEKKAKKERKSLRQMLSQPKEKDAFEIEMENLSKNRRSYTKVTSINKSLFELPQPVVDILVQKLKISMK